MKINRTLIFTASFLLCWGNATAERLVIPADFDVEVVGKEKVVRARHDETLIDIGRQFGVGYDEIVKSNPTTNRWVPGAGRPVFIPSRYVLPDVARRDIVLNLPELRLYYFPPSDKALSEKGARIMHTFPVSIGRRDWKTPLGVTKVVRKDRNPPWYPPESIKREHAAEGDYLPNVVPGGSPDNPLGKFALRLGFPSYLIHGTDERKAYGIGMQVTHGCVRMYPEDIEQMYNLVRVGAKVHIIDEPVKVGWDGSILYLEVHKPLTEDEGDFSRRGEKNDRDFKASQKSPPISLKYVYNKIRKANRGLAPINVKKVTRVVREGTGIAEPIGRYDPTGQYDKYYSKRRSPRPQIVESE